MSFPASVKFLFFYINLWSSFWGALYFDLIKSFGFTDYSLTSKNAVLPIVYYLYHRNMYKDFVHAIKYDEERRIIKKWLHIVLLKRLFGGNSDTVLSQIRRTFTDDLSLQPIKDEIKLFPTDYQHVRKDLGISDEFILELFNTPMENQYTFSILSLLYPYLNYKNNEFHKDHIHPVFQYNNLSSESKKVIDWNIYNSIYNLQMLGANENMSKNNKTLIDWIDSQTDTNNRAKFLNDHLIPNIDLRIENFLEFYEERSKILLKKMKEILV